MEKTVKEIIIELNEIEMSQRQRFYKRARDINKDWDSLKIDTKKWSNFSFKK